jgi:protocatechuate 3,4-dioxygenase beta subunit
LLVAALALTLTHGPQAKAQREPTTQTSIGIFYRPDAPQTADLWQDGDPGERLKLQGRVLDSQGRPVAGALVELWHADSSGSVDESRYRSAQRTRADGGFGIKTVLPGHIEMARYNAVFAPRHIHIVVSHPDYPRLVSLIFFQGDGRLDGTPYPELAVPLEKVRTQDGEVFVAGVEIILGATPLPAGYWEDTD